MKNLFGVVLIATFCAFLAQPAVAQPQPSDAGGTLLQARCGSCHTLDVVRARRSPEEWRQVVLAMIDLGAKVTPEEVPVLVDYLAKNASSTSTPSPAASDASVPSPPPRVRPPSAADVVARLGQSKTSLLDAIQQAERGNGPAISAKFEIEDGKLLLSVYNAKKGMGLEAEYNVLTEMKGDATAAAWQPKLETFEDKEHIARASTQLTLMQTTRMTLSELIQKAAGANGKVFSAIPMIKSGRGVVEMLVALPEGKYSTVILDVKTGEPFD